MTDTYQDQGQDPEASHRHEHWLELRVFAPRDPEERKFVFNASTEVGVAAAEVAKNFGYAPGNHTFQTEKDDVLDRAVSLVAAHVHTGELLELVDVGGGV